MRRYLVVLFLLCANIMQAQNFGGFPPSTQWKQINTDTARIIFTNQSQWQAQRIAALIHKLAADTPVALGKGLKKINIVLHQNTTLANGYVALGPFRSEYYLIPGSNIFEFGNLPWHENLAVHEYRHVQQYNNFNNGVSKLFRLFLGQQGQALANALSVPDWFFEGDAVYAESAFTDMGRGRLPLFLSAYNSLWQEGKDYKWQKLRNGSYKDYVPNHYPLGYLLVNYGYLKYGDEFWKKVTKDASAFNGTFYPFQKSIKKYSGLDYKTFRNDALAFYSKGIEKQKEENKHTVFSNYYFPQYIAPDSILYVKESFLQLPAFFIKNKTGEHRLKLRNISTEDWFSYRQGTIAYTAFATHPRWSLTDYSNIVLLDITSKKEKVITHNAKYYTPDIAPDGKSIIAIAINDSLQTELHLLTTDGTVVKKFIAKDNDYYTHPRFVDAQTIVVGNRQQNGLMTWNLMNIVTGALQPLIMPTINTIGYPYVQDGIIYFTASLTANDDIYAYRLKDKKVFQLTTGKTGNYYAAAYKDTLLWSKFTAEGLQLQKKGLNELNWTEINSLQLQERATAFPVAWGNEKVLETPARKFEVSKYSKSTGLINFHSWDPSGLTLYSNNILNTLAAEVYYHYNESERAHITGFTASYGGWFPVINAGYEYTFGRHIKIPNNEITANEMEARIGYEIPLNLTKGKTLKSLRVGSNYVFNHFMPIGISKTLVSESDNSYLHHFAGWTQQMQKTRQQIYPHLGYALSASYRHLLARKGYQALAGAAVYLPSFSKTHSIVLTGSFQQVDTSNYVFSNRFSLARGYRDNFYSRMWNIGANYHFPLFYPDWGFANIVYFLRVRSNLFFDYSKVYSNNKMRMGNLKSTGTEIFFDTRWLNQLPVTFGVRYSYLLDKEFAPNNRHIFEFIVPVDLIPN